MELFYNYDIMSQVTNLFSLQFTITSFTMTCPMTTPYPNAVLYRCHLTWRILRELTRLSGNFNQNLISEDLGILDPGLSCSTTMVSVKSYFTVKKKDNKTKTIKESCPIILFILLWFSNGRPMIQILCHYIEIPIILERGVNNLE